MKRIFVPFVVACFAIICTTSCQKGFELTNPNLNTTVITPTNINDSDFVTAFGGDYAGDTIFVKYDSAGGKLASISFYKNNPSTVSLYDTLVNKHVYNTDGYLTENNYYEDNILDYSEVYELDAQNNMIKKTFDVGSPDVFYQNYTYNNITNGRKIRVITTATGQADTSYIFENNNKFVDSVYQVTTQNGFDYYYNTMRFKYDADGDLIQRITSGPFIKDTVDVSYFPQGNTALSNFQKILLGSGWRENYEFADYFTNFLIITSAADYESSYISFVDCLIKPVKEVKMKGVAKPLDPTSGLSDWNYSDNWSNTYEYDSRNRITKVNFFNNAVLDDLNFIVYRK